MIRKLMVMLLSGVLCLLAAAPLLAETNWGWSTLQEYEEATGNKIEKFNEAPILRLKVATGELPPIEERLPEEPLVDKPFEEVGTYGGTLRLGIVATFLWIPASFSTMEFMLLFDRKYEKIVPNIAKGWEFSDDGKTFTLYLRKGMKWSDGAPCTADDILFYWEGVISNDDLVPIKPKEWMQGGKLMTVEKVDDYTVRFHFSKPYWAITSYLSSVSFRGAQNDIFLPKHALKKYHIDYNPEADELAKEEGYDYWWQLFNNKRDFLLGRVLNLEIPTLGPWIPKQILSEGVIFERNPYYYKIDTAGNQLPYIDTIKATPFGDSETLALKTVSGEYDYMNWLVALKYYPVLAEGAEKGGYYVWFAEDCEGGTMPVYAFNQNYNEDPIIGDILRDVRFRRALSLAINREEFIEILFYGKGTPRQATVPPTCSFYKEEWATTYAEYDPEEANNILDEMGLDKRDKEGYRLRPDGKTLLLTILYGPEVIPAEYIELTKEYWEEVGVKTTIKPGERMYLVTCVAAGTYMVTPLGFPSTAEFAIAAGMCQQIKGNEWAPQWHAWWNTKGESGEEPPDEVKRLFSLSDEIPYLPKEERNKALTEIFDIWAENLWQIGVVGLEPVPMITNINLKNVITDTYVGISTGFGVSDRLYQSFWKK